MLSLCKDEVGGAVVGCLNTATPNSPLANLNLGNLFSFDFQKPYYKQPWLWLLHICVKFFESNPYRLNHLCKKFPSRD